MSYKKELFLALAEHLEATLVATELLPGVAWVDKDLGQFELMEEGVLNFPLPAVLIAFPDVDFENLLGGDQTGSGVIRLRIGFLNYYDAHTGSPNRTAAMQFFDFNEAVHAAIMAFKQEGITGLQRVNEAEDLNHRAVIITEITYSYTLYNQEPDNNTYVSADAKGRFVNSIPSDDEDFGFVIPK